MSEPWPAPAPHLEGLNPEQLRAVTFPTDRPLLVLAGPGTGKTTVLAARYAHLVLGPSALSPGEVLALTFTHRAAGEMRSRIAGLLEAAGRDGAAPALAGAWIGTFHWFCARLLREYPVAAGVDPEFEVLDRAMSRLVFVRAAPRALGDAAGYPQAPLLRGDLVDEAYRLVMRLKDSLVGPDGFLALALEGAAAAPGAEEAGGDWRLERDTARVVHRLYLAYEAELERRGALDFAGLIGRACALLSTPGVGPGVRRRFRYILVDEFQDTSAAQFYLLRLLAADGRLSNVTVVGDPRQAIYAWRNARVENLSEFRAREWGGEVVELVKNYRSRPPLLEVAGAFLSGGGVPAPPLAPVRGPALPGPGTAPALTLAALPNEASEAGRIADEVRRLLEAGEDPGQVAVLMRGTGPAAWVEEALRQRGVDCRTVGGAAGRELQGLQDLLALLRLARDPHDAPALCRLLGQVFSVPDRELAEFCRAAGADGRPRPPGPALLDPGAEAALALWPWAGAARRLLEEAGAAARALRLPALVEWAAARLDSDGRGRGPRGGAEGAGGAEQGNAAPPGAGGRKERLDPFQVQQVVALACSFESRNPAAGLGEFLAYLGYFLQESQLDPEPPGWDPRPGAAPEGGGRVHIMTVHQAKGLEFNRVLIPGVRPDRFPLKHRGPLLDFWPLPEPGCRAARAPAPALIVRTDADGRATAGYEAQRPRLQAEQMAEERRLFYVALTRARESLYVTRPQPLPPDPGPGDFFAELLSAFPGAAVAEDGRAPAPPPEEPARLRHGAPAEAPAVTDAPAAPRGGAQALAAGDGAGAAAPPPAAGGAGAPPGPGPPGTGGRPASAAVPTTRRFRSASTSST
ncbi:MAG: ATP-dependent helicase [Acetobacteraceae bacterium]|nr:ATP-dependent helicase [Acetobacteraceae bacterium]